VNVIFGAVIDPDVDDEVRVTVIATGFDDRKEKVELPQIRKWAPRKEQVFVKPPEKVAEKTIDYTYAPGPMPRDIFNYEDAVDLPAFLRKSRLKEL